MLWDFVSLRQLHHSPKTRRGPEHHTPSKQRTTGTEKIDQEKKNKKKIKESEQ